MARVFVVPGLDLSYFSLKSVSSCWQGVNINSSCGSALFGMMGFGMSCLVFKVWSWCCHAADADTSALEAPKFVNHSQSWHEQSLFT